jgi:tetratricopeptide (TPR) repeat protein
MDAVPPQRIEVVLEPLNGAENPRRVKVLLLDKGKQGSKAEGTANLDFGGAEVGDGLGAEVFLEAFLRGENLGVAAGMRFGRMLFDRLFDSPAVRDLWKEIQIRGDGKRRMQMLLVTPREEAWLARIPFELLCDEVGFLFRRGISHSLIRTLRGHKAERAQLLPGGSALMAWANPTQNESLRPIQPADLAAHEKAVEQAARQFGWNVLPACQNATRDTLPERLREARPPVQLLSLLAHGDEMGGAVYLAREGMPEKAEPISATDLGSLLHGTGVKLVFLWSCYGGQRPPVGSAVADALLHPEYGGVSAVIAAPGALRAAGTVPFFRELLRSLRDEAQGELEIAVARARLAIPDTDLQWAAPAYYARPLDGQTLDVPAVHEASEQALRSLAVAPQTLVEQADELTAHFRGREQKVEEILGLLRGGSRLITIVGLPGIGKTQLVVAVAQEARKDGALGLERAIWIGMEGVTEVVVVRGHLARFVGLELTESEKDSVLAERIGARRLLVVLDNAEDLLRDKVQAVRFLKFMGALLQQCPGLRFLVSSRQPVGSLGAAQELVRSLDSIEPPADREVFLSWVRARAEEDRSPEEAGRFVQELQASPDLAPLLKVLGGHSLSLVLVAGQVLPGTDLKELRERIERDVDVIRDRNWLGSDVDAVEDRGLRLLRLKSSLNLSFLPLREKHALAASIFTWFGHLPAGLRVELVPVLFGEQARAQVDELRRAYLMRERGGRVSMLAPIQRYALHMQDSTLDARQREEWLLRSVRVIGGWLRVLAEKLGTQQAGPAMEEALREVPNVRVLVEQVVQEPHASDELMQALSDLVVAHAVLMQHIGQAQGALGACEQAASSLRGRPGEANTLKALGDLYVRTARLKEAEEVYGKALPLYRQIDDRLGEANTLQALGDLYVRTARLKEAEEVYGKALPLYRQIDDRLGEANTLQALGDLYVRTARLKEAEEVYGKALPLYRQIDARLGEANTLKALGALYVRTARLKEAEEVYGKALPLYRQIDDRLGEANMYQALGTLELAQGRAAAAFSRYLQALAIHRAIDPILSVGADHGYLSRAARAAGNPIRAAVLANEARMILAQAQDRFGQILSLDVLTPVLAELEDGEGALAAFVTAWAHSHAIGEPSAVQRAQILAQALEGFDPTSEPVPQMITEAEEVLSRSVAACKTKLDAAGEDPYSPI